METHGDALHADIGPMEIGNMVQIYPVVLNWRHWRLSQDHGKLRSLHGGTASQFHMRKSSSAPIYPAKHLRLMKLQICGPNGHWNGIT